MGSLPHVFKGKYSDESMAEIVDSPDTDSDSDKDWRQTMALEERGNNMAKVANRQMLVKSRFIINKYSP